MTSQVLIVEDHPLVAEATAKLVELAGQIQPVVSSDAARTRQLLDQKGDAWFRIFLDLDVPGAYGLSLAREIKDRGLAGRTCVVSASDKVEYIDEVRRSGFLGYIAKAIPVADFETSIRRILDGKATFPDMLASHRATTRLTRRQTQLLEFLRSGLSSREIAVELRIAEGTVNNLVAAILFVVDATTRAQAVARAIELGLLHPIGPYQADSIGGGRRIT